MLGNTPQRQLGLWLPFDKGGNDECSIYSKSFHPIVDTRLDEVVGGWLASSPALGAAS